MEIWKVAVLRFAKLDMYNLRSNINVNARTSHHHNMNKKVSLGYTCTTTNAAPDGREQRRDMLNLTAHAIHANLQYPAAGRGHRTLLRSISKDVQREIELGVQVVGVYGYTVNMLAGW